MMSVDDVSSCEGTKSLGYLYPPPSSGKYDALKWSVEMEGTHTHTQNRRHPLPVNRKNAKVLSIN